MKKIDATSGIEILSLFASSAGLTDTSAVEQEELSTSALKDRHIICAIDGSKQIESKEVRLRIGLNDSFPGSLPDLFILNHKEIGFLPHVENKTGWICYQSPEGVSISLRNQLTVLQTALDQATGIIQDGISKNNRLDVADEMEAYWVEFREISIDCFVNGTDNWKEIKVGTQKGELNYVADNFEKVLDFNPNAKPSTERIGLYIPLPDSSRSDLTSPHVLMHPNALMSHLENYVDGAAYNKLHKLLRSRDWLLLALGIPRSDGSYGLIGIQLKRTQISGDLNARLVFLRRLGPEILRERGGALIKVSDSRVAVIGCGSVGGYVATSLARSGVGHLVLVDPDNMEYENSFRHVLGMSQANKNKVEGLKEEIERTVPYIDVEAVPKAARAAIEEKELDLDSVELVVVTIGNITENRILNEMLRHEGVAAVFSWLEPLGIGGHAVLVHPDSKAGCYECLFVDNDGNESLWARSDFAEPMQRFARDLTGCASVFTPYGDIDARRTANITTRLAIDALVDREVQSSLVSWKGDARVFTESGYVFSERYQLEGSELNATRHKFAHPLCPICREAV